MRLFGLVDGTIDRHDRAGWLTPPFDMAFGAPLSGSIIIDRVENIPSVTIDGFDVPHFTIDDYDLSTDLISIDSVEVIP